MVDFRRIAAAAAMVGIAMGASGAQVMPGDRGRVSTRGAFGSSKRKGSNPAGSKLWRKHHRVGDEVGRMHSNVRGY